MFAFITSYQRGQMDSNKSKPNEQPTKRPLLTTWKDMTKMELPKVDYIIYGLTRGQVGMVQSVTNVGKTTLLLNVCISMACGKAFEPMLETGEPRRIVYMDYETPIAKFVADVRKMMEVLTPEQCELVNQNLCVYNLISPFSDEIRLIDKYQLGRVSAELSAFKPDLLAIDTLSLAFVGVSENDNSDITNRITVPLSNLAVEHGCAVVVTHHIGKEKLEEGRSSVGALRSRGGSSLPSATQVIYQLDRRIANGQDQVWFSFEKLKDEMRPAVRMVLNPDTRWFEPQVGESWTDRMSELMRVVDPEGETKKADIMERLEGSLGSRATVERLLARALEEGRLESRRKGWYCHPSTHQNV